MYLKTALYKLARGMIHVREGHGDGCSLSCLLWRLTKARVDKIAIPNVLIDALKKESVSAPALWTVS